MSNKIAWIIVLVGMFGGLGYLMSINEEKVTSNIVSDVEALTKKFPTGDEITFYPQPVVEPQNIPLEENNIAPIPDVPVDTAEGEQVDEQQTEQPIETEIQDPQSQVFVGSSDLAYARNMDSIQKGTNDQIQLGNIVNIVGTIKLLDIYGEEIPPPPRPKSPAPRVPWHGSSKGEENNWKVEYEEWVEENSHLPNLKTPDELLAIPRPKSAPPQLPKPGYSNN